MKKVFLTEKDIELIKESIKYKLEVNPPLSYYEVKDLYKLIEHLNNH